MSNAATYGRLMTYEEAHGPFDGNSTRRLLENISAGRYWKVSEDFTDGSRFDPSELQAKKALIVLQELDAQIAQLSDGDPLDKQAHVMLLTLQAETRFDESVTKITQKTESPAAQPKVDASEPESSEEKLARAKEFAKGLLQ